LLSSFLRVRDCLGNSLVVFHQAVSMKLTPVTVNCNWMLCLCRQSDKRNVNHHTTNNKWGGCWCDRRELSGECSKFSFVVNLYCVIVWLSVHRKPLFFLATHLKLKFVVLPPSTSSITASETCLNQLCLCDCAMLTCSKLFHLSYVAPLMVGEQLCFFEQLFGSFFPLVNQSFLFLRGGFFKGQPCQRQVNSIHRGGGFTKLKKWYLIFISCLIITVSQGRGLQGNPKTYRQKTQFSWNKFHFKILLANSRGLKKLRRIPSFVSVRSCPEQ
jgi:hypothetical protein